MVALSLAPDDPDPKIARLRTTLLTPGDESAHGSLGPLRSLFEQDVDSAPTVVAPREFVLRAQVEVAIMSLVVNARTESLAVDVALCEQSALCATDQA